MTQMFGFYSRVVNLSFSWNV